MRLRDAEEADVSAILEISNHAVRCLAANWSETEETLDVRIAWFRAQKADGLPVIVAEDEQGQVVGYGYYGPFRSRSGYRLTIEHSVYVRSDFYGRGIGKALLAELIERARTAGYHLMIGVIDGDNAGSVALHEKCGFQTVGRIPQIGAKFGRWLDLVLMTLVLDDRPAPPER